MSSPTNSLKIEQNSLGIQVYNLLWERIANRELNPGDKLSDLRLSEDLGVSRTPVREALYLLAQDGIVKPRSRHGFYVTTFSSHDVREIYDVRTALEVLAVRLALPTLSDSELEQAQQALDKVSQQMRDGDEQASEKFLVVDREFHQLIIAAARNSRLAAMMASLRGQIGVFQVYGTHSRSLTELSIEHHQAILAALKQRDVELAVRAMEHHIQEVKNKVLTDFTSSKNEPEEPTAEEQLEQLD